MDVSEAALLAASTGQSQSSISSAEVQRAIASLAAAGTFGQTENGASSSEMASALALIQQQAQVQAQAQQQAAQQIGTPGSQPAAMDLQHAAAAALAASAGLASAYAAQPQAVLSAAYASQAGFQAQAALANHQAAMAGIAAGQMPHGMEGSEGKGKKGKGSRKGIEDPILLAMNTAMYHLQEAAMANPPQEGWDFDTLKSRLTKYFRSAAKGMAFNRPLETLINEFADSAFNNISWLLQDCRWLRQADFTLVLEVSVNELFPVDVKSGVDRSQLEEYILKAHDRAIEEAAFSPVLLETCKRYAQGKKAQNKLFNSAEAARKEAIVASMQAQAKNEWSPQDDHGVFAKVKAFVRDFINRTLKPFGDWPDSILEEEDCIKLFQKLLQEGCCPSSLTRYLPEPIPDPWDFVKDVISEIYKKAAAKNKEIEDANKSKKAKKAYSLEENHLYKTELCRNWVGTRQCKMGDWCYFAHGEQELHHYQAKASGKASGKGIFNPGDHWRDGKGKIGAPGFGGPGFNGFGMESADSYGFDGFDGWGEAPGWDKGCGGKDGFGKGGWCKGYGKDGYGKDGYGKDGCGKGGFGCDSKGTKLRGKGIFVPPPPPPPNRDRGTSKGGDGMDWSFDKGMPKGGDDMFSFGGDGGYGYDSADTFGFGGDDAFGSPGKGKPMGGDDMFGGPGKGPPKGGDDMFGPPGKGAPKGGDDMFGAQGKGMLMGGQATPDLPELDTLDPALAPPGMPTELMSTELLPSWLRDPAP